MTADVEHLLRTEAPQVLGALVRRFGRFDIAEDAVQEALLAASRTWPADGVPEDPRGWLIRIGYRRMIDLLRSDQARRRREQQAGMAELAMQEPARAYTPQETDDSLTLLLLCCHPALSTTSQVALTCAQWAVLTTAEIAAYGTTETSMGTRISRAKQQLSRAGARFTPPIDADRDSRMAAVMQVLYLIFNEGYTASTGDELDRIDLTREAIRLTRMLRDSLPDHAEVTGLLALMLLTESRRTARTRDGELVPLEKQDRTQWNTELIGEGTELIDSVWGRREAGLNQLQAAIAAVHANAASPERTDWPQIAALYCGCEQLTPTAPVRLSRVVAVAHAYGPARGWRCSTT